MLISSKYRFIFIHVYKNAGSSITAALLPFAASPVQRKLSSAAKRVGISLLDPQPYPTHIKARELCDRLGSVKFQSYYSFAIVRNPWDWQVSLYNYMLKTPEHHQHEFATSLANFDEYIRWRCTEEVRFQKDFVCDERGELLVDKLGRYENLEQDFEAICTRIGIKAALPRLNVSKTKPWRSYYTPETIELVRKTFAPDIEFLGYQFE